MDDISYYLVCLMEECAEVIQATSKNLRFGLDDYHPKTGDISNHILLSKECGDVLGVIDELIRFNILDEEVIAECRAKKPAKIKLYKEMHNGQHS